MAGEIRFVNGGDKSNSQRAKKVGEDDRSRVGFNIAIVSGVTNVCGVLREDGKMRRGLVDGKRGHAREDSKNQRIPAGMGKLAVVGVPV